MKRITVSLPDALVDAIRGAAGEGQVSAYVARVLAEDQERETLDEILAAWEAETPVPDEVKRQVAAEFDAVGLTGPAEQDRRMAG